jgi:hypothetical protein
MWQAASGEDLSWQSLSQQKFRQQTECLLTDGYGGSINQ